LRNSTRGGIYARMFGLGSTEIVLILVVMLVVFGASRLPALGRGLGEGLRGFKEALRGDEPAKKSDDLARKDEEKKA
jgi:sec-independent protein translocase protein TatA